MAEGRFEDLLALDRDVARAAKALASWRAVLADRPDEAAESDPFDGLRVVAAKSTWERLGELSPSAADEPLRAALRRWVLALVQARVGAVDDVAWAREAATARGLYEGERHWRVSWREAWRGLASGRSAAEARLWLEAASDAAAPLAPVARLRSARRAEVARRMGLAHPWAPVASVDLGRLRASAARFLERTDDLSRAVWRESLGAEPGVAAVLHAAVAREAGDGWPARLTPRWIEEQFGAGVRGLPLDLPALPATLGAASFARALALFGHAFRVASAQRSLPFALASEPWFDRRPPARVRLRGARGGSRVSCPRARRRSADRRAAGTRPRAHGAPRGAPGRGARHPRRGRGGARVTPSTRSARASSAPRSIAA